MRRRRIRQYNNSIPLWMLAAAVLAVVGFIELFKLIAQENRRIADEQRKEEMLKREPWRNYIRPEYRYNPNPR